MGDPRFDNKMADIKAVQRHVGWYVIENIAEIKGQGSSTPYITSEPSAVCWEQTYRFLGTGTHYGIDIYVELGADTPTVFTSSVYASVARFRLEVQGTFGTGGGGYALHAAAIYGANAELNGELCAGRFDLDMDAAVHENMGRTFQCVYLRSNLGEGITFPTGGPSAFIKVRDNTAIRLPALINFAQAASDTAEVDDGCIIAKTVTPGAMCIRVLVNGTWWYIAMGTSIA